MTYYSIFLAAAEAAAETTAEGGLFDINATLPLMALQFLVLMAVLNALLYKPLGAAIDSRTDYVRNSLKDARELKEKSEMLAAQYDNELRDVRREAQSIIADAKAEVKTHSKKLQPKNSRLRTKLKLKRQRQ